MCSMSDGNVYNPRRFENLSKYCKKTYFPVKDYYSEGEMEKNTIIFLDVFMNNRKSVLYIKKKP